MENRNDAPEIKERNDMIDPKKEEMMNLIYNFEEEFLKDADVCECGTKLEAFKKENEELKQKLDKYEKEKEAIENGGIMGISKEYLKKCEKAFDSGQKIAELQQKLDELEKQVCQHEVKNSDCICVKCGLCLLPECVEKENAYRKTISDLKQKLDKYEKEKEAIENQEKGAGTLSRSVSRMLIKSRDAKIDELEKVANTMQELAQGYKKEQEELQEELYKKYLEWRNNGHK